MHAFIVTTNNWFNNYLLLRLMIQNFRAYSHAAQVSPPGGVGGRRREFALDRNLLRNK